MTMLNVQAAYDRAHIASLAMTGRDEAFAALDRADALHRDRDAWLPLHVRRAVLESFAQGLAARAEEFVRQAAQEGGKPLQDSRIEVQRAVEGAHAAVHALAHATGQEVAMAHTARGAGRFAHTFRDPRGVVLAVSAFNHPVNLIVHQVVPAVAAGCPVLIKPARDTPLSCRDLVALLREAGLPPAWCQMLLCDPAVIGEMVADPRMGFLSFIGSARIGWMLRAQLAPGAHCALEHGGVAPVIVDASADLDEAVPALLKASFAHAGQVCVSAQRIYVHASVCDAFCEAFVAGARDLRVGDPLSPATEVGPMIRPSEVERVHSWVQEALQAGGKLRCGGTRLSETCFAPTVVYDPPDDVQLSTDEVFGPVVAIYPYADRLEAIRRANEPDVYFQASVYTRDLDTALDTSRRLHGMAVMINDHPAFRIDNMPFGGHRGSGLGVGGIAHTMRDMSIERMVVFRSPAFR